MGELDQIGRNVLAIPVVRRPIVNAVRIDASSEEIRVAAEAERGEITAVTAAPEPDALRLDLGAALQIFSGGDNVLIFGRATASAPRSFAKCTTVADAAAIVDSKRDVTMVSQKLIHGVGIRVVIHVVPAEEHLAN